MKLAFVGGFGHHYLRGALAFHPDWQIAVSGDGVDSQAAQSLCKKISYAQWFEGPRDMLDSFAPDLVSVGAVYGVNGDMVALALERDISVVSDKPVAATWTQLERLRELTQGNSRALLTEFPFRSQREFRAARQAVNEGAVGEVVLATAQKSYRFGDSRPQWYGDRDLYGGTLLWIASHGIDAIRFCTGQEFTCATGTRGNLSRSDYGSMEDHVTALFELGNGGSAIVHADFLRPQSAPTHGDDRLRIAGSQGVVEVRDGRCALISGSQGARDITDSVQVRAVHEELLAALHGETDEFYSTVESLGVAEILLKARDAVDGRQWVSL